MNAYGIDRRQLFGWLGGILGRGIAWVLAVKLGIESTRAADWAASAGQALAALALVAVSVYSSVRGRRKLLTSEPPPHD